MKESCHYCKDYNDEIHSFSGKDFELVKTAGYEKEHIKYKVWIMKGKPDEKAGIMISEGGGNAVYTDINYCPMCGRKLGWEEIRLWK